MGLKSKSRTYTARMPSNGEAPRFGFQKKLGENKKEFAALTLQFMLASLATRRNAWKEVPFSKTTKEFLKTHIPLCFAHLELRVSKISKISEELASESEAILEHKDGYKMFSWLMERAIVICEGEGANQFLETISNLFCASAKICKNGKSADIPMFFSAFDGVDAKRARQMLKEIKCAQTYSELHGAISRTHSEATKPDPRSFINPAF